MAIAIDVHELGKKYVLRHRRAESYVALRDALTQGAQDIAGRFLATKRVAASPSSTEEFWALNDVSFTVSQGERIGIIGRNGAGKSTLLKVLSRITEPSCGRVVLHGRVSSLLEVGTGFHPELTGRENIYLNGAVLGMARSEISRQFDEIVAFAEVERFLDTPVKRYSSGMYVRLAFAVAAHLESEILIVDEVLAVGDAQFQSKCLGKLEEIGRDGRTVLFVSHDMRAIKALCDYGIVMSNGRASEKCHVDCAVTAYSSQMESCNVSFPLEAEDIAIHSFSVSQDGQENAELDGGKSISIEIDFEVHRNLTGFRLGVYLKSAIGGLVFRSLLPDWSPQREAMAIGRYSCRLDIPANLLAPGAYILNLHASCFGIKDYLEDAHVDVRFAVRPPLDFNAAHIGELVPGAVILNSPWTLQKA